MKKKELKVLLIGRNEDINEILELMLVRRGINAKCLSIGRKVLEAIKDDRPDIIILDIERWSMDEMMLNEEIKTDAGIKDIPIIFCVPEHVQEIVPYKNDNDEYLRKPFEFEELYKKICSIINSA